MKNYKVDKTEVKIFETREEMGKAAAYDIKNRICELLEEKKRNKYDFCRRSLSKRRAFFP